MTNEQPPVFSNEAIGRRLRRVREMMGWTQAGAAEMFSARSPGIAGSQQGWVRYEKGIVAVPIELGALIAQETGIPMDWLFRGVEHFLPPVYKDALTGPEGEKPARKRRAAGSQVH